jgi:ATP-dependent exoDNAse (exonuclease V) beta subunit
LWKGAQNATEFAALEETPAACPLTSAAKVEELRGGQERLSALTALDSKMGEKARRHGNDFIRKFNPSAYDPEIVGASSEDISERPVRVKATPDTPATLYGQWWHSFFQRMPWRNGTEAADSLFGQLLPMSPDKRRATAEWKLVRRGLASDPSFKQFVSSAKNQMHSEFPFACSINPHTVLEGLIDLLIIDPAGNRCLLVDWKTNRIEKGEEEQLRERYRPQLAAYWKAVREITKLQVDAGIFATAIGQFMPYEDEELEAEWERLRSLPADEFREAVLL